MEKLGYIISDRKLKNIDGFVEQVNDISLTDSTKPVLIIGWNNAKKDKDYTSILNKQLRNNVYWTFSRSESRVDFEEDLENFYNIIYNNILDKINYFYINIFKLKYCKIKKIYNILFSKEVKNIYISNSMVYFPYKGDILGISLNILEYYGIKREKILKMISSNPSNRILEDDDKFVFKLARRLGNKKYAVPYFIRI